MYNKLQSFLSAGIFFNQLLLSMAAIERGISRPTSSYSWIFSFYNQSPIG